MTNRTPHSTPSPRTRRWIGVALVPVAVAATMITVAVATGLGTDRQPAGIDPAAGAGVVEAPTGSDPAAVPAADQPYDGIPQLLITEPGWTVTYFVHGEYDGQLSGEWQADNGAIEAQLSWYPGDALAVRDPDNGSGEYREVTPPGEVVGGPARLFINTYSEEAGHITWRIVWPAFGYVMELNVEGVWSEDYSTPGVSPTEDQVRALMRSITWVDDQTWEAALPDSVVLADQRATVVPEMLSDISLPDGFDTAPLIEGDTNGRYDLGAEVTGAVVCEWIDVWLAATDAGDDAGVAQAQEALAGARDWAVLQEMTETGALPEVMWEFTDAVVAGDRDGVAGREGAIGCG